MALNSKKGNIGSDLIDFALKGTDRKIHSPSDYKDKKIIAVIFMCNHCPYVIAVIDRLVRMQESFSVKSVQFIGINSNDVITYPEDSFENMVMFAKEKKMNFPYLYDETQEIARKYDAACTPDIYVYDEKRILRYRGRIDDNWKEEELVKSRDLEKAIEILLSGGEINFEQIPSLGCSIKWKN